MKDLKDTAIELQNLRQKMTTLKAEGYDILAQQEELRRRLQQNSTELAQTDQEIKKLSDEPK